MKTNNNQQKPKGFKTLPSLVDTGEGSAELNLCTTFQTSPVHNPFLKFYEYLDVIKPFPKLCDYHKEICPKNIPKYSMKCIYHNKECNIKKYFDRFRRSDLIKLGLGSRV